ncbi:MAG TPA: hypothetical protein VJ816_04350 [Gemmatimonadales bacterium]|nr:hypothetical protein [Gemmatimonadales bacterium]
MKATVLEWSRGRGPAPLRVHPSFWRTEWTITDAEGAPLVRAVRGPWSRSRWRRHVH